MRTDHTLRDTKNKHNGRSKDDCLERASGKGQTAIVGRAFYKSHKKQTSSEQSTHQKPRSGRTVGIEITLRAAIGNRTGARKAIDLIHARAAVQARA